MHIKNRGKNMNVYDFDKTIYDGDSSVHFYLFSIKKNPIILRRLFKQLISMIKYKLNIITKTQMKTIIYEYFQDIDDIDALVKMFWKKNNHKLKDWYLKQRKDDDVIISASPTFLLQPICDSLNVKLIASVVDKKTGENKKENCYGKEKPIRFKEHYAFDQMDTFYSDSYSDDPMAKLAKKAILVKKNQLLPW